MAEFFPSVSTQLLSTSKPGYLTRMLNEQRLSDEEIAASQSRRAYNDTLTENNQFSLREAIKNAQKEEQALGLIAQLIGGQQGQAFALSPTLAASGQTFKYNEEMNPLNLEGKKLSNIDTADVTRSRGLNDNLAVRADNRASQMQSFRIAQARQAQAMQAQRMQQDQTMMRQQQATAQEREFINKFVKAGEIALQSPEQWGGIRQIMQEQTGVELPEAFNPEWIKSNVNELKNQLAIMDAGTGIDNNQPTLNRITGNWYEKDIKLSAGDKTAIRKKVAGINRVSNIVKEMRDIVEQEGGSFKLSKTAAKMNTLNKNFQNALKDAEAMGALQDAEIKQMEAMVPDTVGIAPNLFNTRKDSWVTNYTTMLEQLENNLNTTLQANGLVQLKNQGTMGDVGSNNTNQVEYSSPPQEDDNYYISPDIPRTVRTPEELASLPKGTKFVTMDGKTGIRK